MLLIIEPAALGPAASPPAAATAPGTAAPKAPDEPSDQPKAPDESRGWSKTAEDPRGWPMRRGTLTALKKLSERGIQPAMKDGSHPEPGIHALLEQEEITLADPDSKAWKDRPLDRLRVTVAPDGSLIVSKDGDGTGHATVSPSDPHKPGGSDVDSIETGNAQNDSGPSFPDWPALAAWLLGSRRTATRNRKTAETDISVRVNLDGTGKSRIDTGIPFYDHMLDQIARHGYMDIDVACRGDLEIDEHHTIEDTAIALGEAIGEALGDKRGIGRYGFAVAMDETRSLVAIDLSGRPWCVFEGTFRREKVGDFPTEMTSHFFHSLAMALKATLHVSVKGENDHHQIEACFKGLARCLRQAVDRNEDYLDILPSSKGML